MALYLSDNDIHFKHICWYERGNYNGICMYITRPP